MDMLRLSRSMNRSRLSGVVAGEYDGQSVRLRGGPVRVVRDAPAPSRAGEGREEVRRVSGSGRAPQGDEAPAGQVAAGDRRGLSQVLRGHIQGRERSHAAQAGAGTHGGARNRLH